MTLYKFDYISVKAKEAIIRREYLNKRENVDQESEKISNFTSQFNLLHCHISNFQKENKTTENL